MNESNLLVSPVDSRVTLVDADSLQVRDAETDTVYRSGVGKAEFTPPELQGVSFGEIDRTEVHDRFGLAVLLYLLLMEGTHPFAVRMDSDREALPVEARIRRGLFPHARANGDCHPPRLSPRFDALHPPLQALFARAFVQGHADPASRPSPAEWRDALAEAEAALATCTANPLHRHGSHLAACPWCERTALLGGRDPFPPPGTVAVQAPRPPRPRRVAAPPAAGRRPAPAPTTYAPRPMLRHFGQTVPAAGVLPALANPMVAFIPSAVLAMQGGLLGIFAAVAAVVSLVALFRSNGRNVRISSVIVAILLAALLSVVADAARGADPTFPPPAEFPPIGVSPVPGAEPAPPALPAPTPRATRTVDDFMISELRSMPVSQAPSALPDAPVIPDAEDVADYDAPDLDARPYLQNSRKAARVLATAFTHGGVVRDRPDTVVVWLRIGVSGRVTDHQVVTSTSSAAAAAVVLAIPYLSYAPGEKDGRQVPAWVSQRMIVVP